MDRLVIGWAATIAGAGMMAYGVRGRSATWFAPSFHRGPRERRAVALTYDDGPSAGTLDILEQLDKHRAKATFFQCGAHVDRHPQITREVLANGHEIGNHTFHHPNFAFKTPALMRAELSRTQTAFQNAAGVLPKWFRAPYGVRWPGLGGVQKELGLQGVMWTVIGQDWRLGSKEVAARVVSRVQNGFIVCLHDGREMRAEPDVTSTIEATRILLPILLDRGYRLVTVTELLWPKT